MQSEMSDINFPSNQFHTRAISPFLSSVFFPILWSTVRHKARSSHPFSIHLYPFYNAANPFSYFTFVYHSVFSSFPASCHVMLWIIFDYNFSLNISCFILPQGPFLCVYMLRSYVLWTTFLTRWWMIRLYRWMIIRLYCWMIRLNCCCEDLV